MNFTLSHMFILYSIATKCINKCVIHFLFFFIILIFLSLSSALVWGTSVKHNPQKVGKDHVLNDEDVVQVVKK